MDRFGSRHNSRNDPRDDPDARSLPRHAGPTTSGLHIQSAHVSAADFHLAQLSRLLLPTLTTRSCMHAVLQAEERHGVGARSCNGGRSTSTTTSTSGVNGSNGAGSGCGGGGIAKGCDTIGGTGAGAVGAGADNDAASDLVDVGGTHTGERGSGISLCTGEMKSSCLKEACSAPGKPGAAEPGTVGGREAKGVGVGVGDSPAPAVAAAEAAAVAAMAEKAAKVAAAAAAAGRGATVLDDGTWLDMWTSLVNVLEVGCARTRSGGDWDW